MGYYPIYLEMTDRRCVVIGGGAVAERKVEGLLEAGAAVVNLRIVTPYADCQRLGGLEL